MAFASTKKEWKKGVRGSWGKLRLYLDYKKGAAFVLRLAPHWCFREEDGSTDWAVRKGRNNLLPWPLPSHPHTPAGLWKEPGTFMLCELGASVYSHFLGTIAPLCSLEHSVVFLWRLPRPWKEEVLGPKGRAK